MVDRTNKKLLITLVITVIVAANYTFDAMRVGAEGIAVIGVFLGSTFGGLVSGGLIAIVVDWLLWRNESKQ